MANFNAQFDDKGSVDALVKIYEDTANKIQQQLIDMAGSVSQIARRNQIMASIKAELASLGAATGTWVDTNIPMQYKIGMQTAITQIQELDFLPLTTEALFTTPNRESVKALISDTASSFADSLTTAGRSAKAIQTTIFQKEIKARLAEGTITGETKKSMVADIKQKILDQGITSLTDKGGTTWSLDRYASMLATTKLAEARNTGLANKMLENGNDLVQVSTNGSIHPACQVYEGIILSLTGQTDGYDTVDDATANGLFHPNCQHTINAITPDLAQQTYGYNSDTGQYDQGIITPTDNTSDFSG